MRIDGSKALEFTSYKPLPVTFNRNNVIMARSDILDISDLGRDLEKIHKDARKTDLSKSVQAFKSDGTLELISLSVMEMADTMDRMKSLAELASEDYLSKEDRLILQGQMTELQADLFRQSHSMGLKRLGKSQKEIEACLSEIDRYVQSYMAILDKERDRISGAGPLKDLGDGLFQAEFLGGAPKRLEGLTYRPTKYGEKVLGDKDALTKLLDQSDIKLSFTDFAEASSLSVMTVQKALDSWDSLDKRLKEMDAFMTDLSEFYNRIKDDEISVPSGPEKSKDNFKNPQFSPFQSDVRIKSPKTPQEKVFKMADEFLKDRIFARLSFGDFIPKGNYPETGGPRYVALV